MAIGGAGLLLHCATANQDCPAGQELNEEGTACVGIQCEGGTVEGNSCVCPVDLVLSDGGCVDSACADINCNDDNPCTIDGTCNPITRQCEGEENASDTTPCDEGGGTVCDGRGNCVECNQPSDCPEALEECKARSCTDNTCGSDSVAPNGTFCDGGAGICEDGGCEPADQCAKKDCSDGEQCTVDLCERSTGICSNPPVADETPCDAGPPAGLCLEGACLRVALDDSLDPVDDINVDFNRGGLVTVTNRVSYPLGDTEDVVSYRINKTSNSFFGRLTIKVNCDDPGPSDFEIFANGQTQRCGELVVNRIITDVSGNTGFVRMTAIGGVATFVEWELQFLTCQDNGSPCFQ